MREPKTGRLHDEIVLALVYAWGLIHLMRVLFLK
jgi:hypothetical protein